LETRPFCLCIAGPNGSGKSTFTKRLKSIYALTSWIDPDVVAKEIAGSNKITPEISLRAFRDARARRVQLAVKLESFGFETVLSHSSNVEFLEALGVLGYDLHLFFICTENPEINISRVENRVTLGGHDVPRPKIVDRYKRSLHLAFYASRVVQRMVLFDSSSANGPGRLVGEVLNHGAELRLFPSPIIPLWTLNAVVAKYANHQHTKPFPFLTDEKFSYKTASFETVQERKKFLTQFLIQ
jgi:predicted ABC-type ATPase